MVDFVMIANKGQLLLVAREMRILRNSVQNSLYFKSLCCLMYYGKVKVTEESRKEDRKSCVHGKRRERWKVSKTI